VAAAVFTGGTAGDVVAAEGPPPPATVGEVVATHGVATSWSRQSAVMFCGWVCFLISSGSPHARPVGRTCGEPGEIELGPIVVGSNGPRSSTWVGHARAPAPLGCRVMVSTRASPSSQARVHWLMLHAQSASRVLAVLVVLVVLVVVVVVAVVVVVDVAAVAVVVNVAVAVDVVAVVAVVTVVVVATVVIVCVVVLVAVVIVDVVVVAVVVVVLAVVAVVVVVVVSGHSPSPGLQSGTSAW